MRINFLLGFLTLGILVAIGQPKHQIYIAGGYAQSIADGKVDDQHGRIGTKDPVSNEISFIDSRPRLAEGNNYSLGYAIALNEQWMLSTEASYLDGRYWERVDHSESQYSSVLGTEAENWRWLGGLKYSIGRKEKFDRRNMFSNVYINLGVGGVLFKSTIDFLRRSEDATPSHLTFASESEFYKGLGYGAFGQFDLTFQVTPVIYTAFIVRYEHAVYRTTWVKTTRRERDNVVNTNEEIINFSPVEEFPMSNIFFGVNLGINLNP